MHSEKKIDLKLFLPQLPIQKLLLHGEGATIVLAIRPTICKQPRGTHLMCLDFGDIILLALLEYTKFGIEHTKLIPNFFKPKQLEML